MKKAFLLAIIMAATYASLAGGAKNASEQTLGAAHSRTEAAIEAASK